MREDSGKKKTMVQEYKDIVWLQTAFIGDIVLTSGAIDLAARSFPGIRQHLISTSVGCKVLKGSSHLSERIVFSKDRNIFSSFVKVKKQIRALKLDPHRTVILQVHRSLRSSLLSRYLGFKTVTYSETVASWMADERVQRDRNAHEVVRVASLLSALGLSETEIGKVHPVLNPLDLDLSIGWQRELSYYQGKVFALAVGSQWGTKRWPIEKYEELSSLLLEKTEDVALLFVGSKEEALLTDPLVERLKESFPKKKVWNLCGLTTFDDLRRIFPNLDGILTNDSSPVHFASAFRVPTVCIFGPTVPDFGFGPLAERSKIIQHRDLDCRPCSDHGPQVCPLKHFRCMKEISVQEVFVECHSLIS